MKAGELLHPPAHHVGTLYRISRKKVEKLSRAGYETLLDLPGDYVASAPARRQIKSARTGKLIVERGLGHALAKLQGPLGFLDFETVIPPLPTWPGCRPYAQVPVQLSCHLLRGDKLEHRQWLAEGAGDPRRPFAQALLEACQGAETIVAYNASFEVQRIEALYELLPDLAPQLRKLRKRIVDLLPIVRDHVYHPDFRGSFSLKAVLPALVPGLGYGDLDVKDGQTASALLEAMLLDSNGMTAATLGDLRRKLLSYCERDTLAMVKLYERLTELASTKS